jgi:ABC-2 type transport system permease protein
MRLEVMRREIGDHWRGILAWCVGAVLLSTLYMLFYPSIRRGGAGIQHLLNTMPKAFRNAFLGAGVDYLSPAGYLGTELFSLLLPALMLVMAVLAGSRALAGEERNGTIDLLLATPIRRLTLSLQKVLGALLPVFVVGAAIWAAAAAIGPSQGLSVNLGTLAAALVAVALLATGFGMLAFLVASATGSPGAGGEVAGAAAIAMYVLNVFGSLVPRLTGFADAVSPFHWTGGAGVLVHGVAWSSMLALAVCPVVLLIGATLLYERRDLTT